MANASDVVTQKGHAGQRGRAVRAVAFFKRRKILIIAVAAVAVAVVWWLRRDSPHAVEFDIRMTVCAEDDAFPLEGVRVTLRVEFPDGARGSSYDGPVIEPRPLTTSNEMGDVEIFLRDRSDIIQRYRPRWKLVLEKKGYQTEVVDVSPDPSDLPRELPYKVRGVVYLWPEGAEREVSKRD